MTLATLVRPCVRSTGSARRAMTSASEKVKQGILGQNFRAMDSQARTLREAFGDLPGLEDT